jgi:hypothetical protein
VGSLRISALKPLAGSHEDGLRKPALNSQAQPPALLAVLAVTAGFLISQACESPQAAMPGLFALYVQDARFRM